jgi:hypothetical protein
MVTAAASVAVAAVAPRQAPGLEHIRGHWLGYEDLKVLEGERVRLVGSSGQVLNARVIDVRDNSTTHRGVRVEQVSVLMRTGLSEPAADHTFRIEHPRWGSCRLFCSPVFSTSRGIQYEATISRLAD